MITIIDGKKVHTLCLECVAAKLQIDPRIDDPNAEVLIQLCYTHHLIAPSENDPHHPVNILSTKTADP